MPKRISILLAFLPLLFFFFRGPIFAQEEFPRKGFLETGYIDTHMHLNPMTGGPAGQGPGQKRPGMRQRPGPGGMRQPPGAPRGPRKDYESAADQLILKMNQLGVAKAVVMPPPQGPNQKSAHTYPEFLTAIQKYPQRLLFAGGGGELNPLIIGTDPSSVTPEMEAGFRKQAGDIIRDGAKAFGEMAALHYSFSESHVFEQAAADHPLFFLLADLAAEYDVPIDLHMEAVPEDQPTPQALREVSSHNPEVTQDTIPAFERLLAHNRNARIVWTHVGWDNTGHLTVGLLRRLLSEHPNLFCAIKFVRQDYESFGRGNKLWNENTGALDPEWIELIRAFPERFMAGADEFVGTGRSPRRTGPPSFEDTWNIIAGLPEDIRDQVARANAARVYKL